MQLEDLKNTWEENKSRTTQENELTMEQLTAILSTRTENTTTKMKNGIAFSLLMNLILLSGAVTILIFFNADTISLIIGVASVIILAMLSLYSFVQYRALNTIDQDSGTVRDALITRIDFFKIGYRWIILSLGLNGAFVYILGSATYLNLKYGHITLETDDIIVNLIAITLALSIGLFTNSREHNRYLQELEVCLADLENREVSEYGTEVEAGRKRKYVAAAVLGLVLLVLIILFVVFSA